MLEIDRKAKSKAAVASGAMDGDAKRMEMYRQMRDDLIKEDNKAKNEGQQKKIEQLNSKMAAMDGERKREEEARQLQEE